MNIVAATDGLVIRLLTDPGAAWHAAVDAVAETVKAAAPVAGAGAVALAAGGTAVAGLRARNRAALRTGSRVVTILLPPEVDPAGAETLWRNLHDLLRSRWRRAASGQPHLGFEYQWNPDGLAIRMWVPGPVPPGMVERAVESAWPGARTVTSAPPHGRVVGPGQGLVAGRLQLARAGWWPLRTDHDADPLRSLLGAAVTTHVGEALVQVLARPAGQREVTRCRRAARDIRTGRHPSRVARVLDLLLPATPRHRPTTDPAVGPDVRAVLNKADSPLWTVAVRYAVAGEEGDRRVLRGRAHALASAFAIHAGRNRFVRRRLRRAATVLDRRGMRRGDLLSTAELAAIAHLPLDRILPGVARAGARSVPAPPAVVSERGGKVLGDADAGSARPIVLSPADARYHLHVLGSTGSGKSTLLTRLVLDDVDANRGVVVIDPKGDLVTDVLARVDRRRVVLLDPSSPEGRPALNVLERTDGVGDDLVVDHLVGILSRIFERHWGPRLEDALRSACLTLLRGNGPMLSDVPRILTTRGKWKEFLGDSDSDELAGFWHWYEALNDGQRAQVVGPLLYKLRAFLLRPAVREIVSAPRSDLDVPGVLNEGKLLLVRVPKGTLGEDTSRLLGSFVVAKVWQAATARASLLQDERRDASVYVDECQNFVTTLPRSFDEVLAEARGYRVSFVLAHQHLGQLPRDLRDSVSANARNKVFFTVSPEDAFVLARHTTPNLTDHDLANLGAYQAAVRLVVDGQDQPAFTMRTRPTETAA